MASIGHHQQTTFFERGRNTIGADNKIAFFQFHPANATGRSAHFPYIRLFKPNRLTRLRGQNHLVALGHRANRQQQIAITKFNSDDATPANVFKTISRDFFDLTVFGHHQEREFHIFQDFWHR